MNQNNLQNQVINFKDTYTPGKLYHFILFYFESTNYGDNLDRVLDPKSIMNR